MGDAGVPVEGCGRLSAAVNDGVANLDYEGCCPSTPAGHTTFIFFPLQGLVSHEIQVRQLSNSESPASLEPYLVFASTLQARSTSYKDTLAQ